MNLSLYDSKAIAEMYGVTVQTARKYMKFMGCKDKPFRVTEQQIKAWNRSREKPPVDYLEAFNRHKKVKLLLRSMKGVAER